MTTYRAVYPQPPKPGAPDDQWRNWANELVRQLEVVELTRSTPASKNGYSTSNYSTDREIDPSSDTTEQIGDVLATLITDLREKGIIK